MGTPTQGRAGREGCVRHQFPLRLAGSLSPLEGFPLEEELISHFWLKTSFQRSFRKSLAVSSSEDVSQNLTPEAAFFCCLHPVGLRGSPTCTHRTSGRNGAA